MNYRTFVPSGIQLKFNTVDFNSFPSSQGKHGIVEGHVQFLSYVSLSLLFVPKWQPFSVVAVALLAGDPAVVGTILAAGKVCALTAGAGEEKTQLVAKAQVLAANIVHAYVMS